MITGSTRGTFFEQGKYDHIFPTKKPIISYFDTISERCDQVRIATRWLRYTIHQYIISPVNLHAETNSIAPRQGI